MLRVVLAILLFGTLQGSGQNDTDTKDSLEKIKSGVDALSYLIVRSLQGTQYKGPSDHNADCSWKKTDDSVVTDGYLIPGAKTFEACQDACERTKDCLYFDWVSCHQLCYLPIQPTAQRYELTCTGLTTDEQPRPTTAKLPPPPPPEPEISTTPETTPLPSPSSSETENPTTPETTPLPFETASALPSPSVSESDNPSTPETTSPLPSEATSPLPSPSPTEADYPTTPETTSPLPLETSALPPTTSTESPTRPTVPVCKRRLDLAFVVDGSGSICNVVSSRYYNASCANWDFNLQFIHKIIERLVIGPHYSRVALIKFATTVKVEWTLNKYTDMASLLYAVDRLSYPTGMTNTAGGLHALVTKVFTEAGGDRPDVPNRVILITDGEPNIETIPLSTAIKAVHRNGIKILVVGVTKNVNEKILRDISSPPHKLNETYFLAKDYSSIDLVGEELLKETCFY